MENELNIIDIGYEPPVQPLILVVDDEPAVQAVINDSLKGPYRLVSAYNGREGIDKAVNVKPDLILMDVMMPDIGGYDALRLLYNNKVTHDIPVVMMTAHDFDSSTITLIRQEPNVVAFLSKPFRPVILRETIKTIMERKGKNS